MKPAQNKGVRGRGRPFRPGRSGNPGGRPKEGARVRALAQERIEEALAVLVQIMRSGKSEAARLTAAIVEYVNDWRSPEIP